MLTVQLSLPGQTTLEYTAHPSHNSCWFSPARREKVKTWIYQHLRHSIENILLKYLFNNQSYKVIELLCKLISILQTISFKLHSLENPVNKNFYNGTTCTTYMNTFFFLNNNLILYSECNNFECIEIKVLLRRLGG